MVYLKRIEIPQGCSTIGTIEKEKYIKDECDSNESDLNLPSAVQIQEAIGKILNLEIDARKSEDFIIKDECDSNESDLNLPTAGQFQEAIGKILNNNSNPFECSSEESKPTNSSKSDVEVFTYFVEKVHFQNYHMQNYSNVKKRKIKNELLEDKNESPSNNISACTFDLNEPKKGCTKKMKKGI